MVGDARHAQRDGTIVAQPGVPGGWSLMTGSERMTGLMGQPDSVRTNKDSWHVQILVRLLSLLLGPSPHFLIKSSFHKTPSA